jgi:N-acetylglucosamine-6-sulfatase
MSEFPFSSACRPSLRPDYSSDQLKVWSQSHEALVERARQGEIEVAFFGDSITDGWRNQGRTAWDMHFAPLRAAAFGIPGDRIQQLHWRMQNGELDGYHPHAVVLLIGTNNLDPGLGEPSLTPRNSPAEIVAGVSAILHLVKNRFPHAHILLHGLLPRGHAGDAVRDEIVAVNSGLRQLEEKDPNLHFFAAHSVFLQPDGELGVGFTADGLHLNEDGYQIWATALQPSLLHILSRSG